MGEELKKRLKMKVNPPVRVEVNLNLSIASKIIENRFDRLISKYGITIAQYNVLRILRGVYPAGHPRCDIAIRMMDVAPDITRLIDRLEKQGLVVRDRTNKDRRMSITKLTDKGLKFVNDIQPVIDNEHKKITKNLTDKECGKLSKMLEKLYKDTN
jgi:DNA-binding MarR family transcriptional regulator